FCTFVSTVFPNYHFHVQNPVIYPKSLADFLDILPKICGFSGSSRMIQKNISCICHIFSTKQIYAMIQTSGV
ncbi:hypothetical protein, partial [Butyricicoccus sp.]|uniref:hypothetical protein n=1 Tax=Butyricicoccus sp. TaxID=2049021 RepID=UPI003AAFC090